MLFLLLELGRDRYALDARQVAEVLPLVDITRLPQAPPSVGHTRLLGLIAERATNTVRREAADFVASGVTNDKAPYLGPVATDARGLMQWLDAGTLLPVSVRDMLFRPSKAE
jgi:chemotaxis-related protein WspB